MIVDLTSAFGIILVGGMFQLMGVNFNLPTPSTLPAVFYKSNASDFSELIKELT